ncbi:hypothetical protein VNO77_03359 [Canavalia gladiata]|uniref:Uncharacterized protein n=1 Tax=Canavalia gladiata TaxID=3824 RepID=A0AAN9R828_CANGL
MGFTPLCFAPSIYGWSVSSRLLPVWYSQQAELVGEARDLLATLTCHGHKLVFDSEDSYSWNGLGGVLTTKA